MNITMKTLFLILIVLLTAPVLAGQLGWLAGTMPNDLGVRDGRLKAPSLTRNSVSSQASLHPDHPQLSYAQIAPFALRKDGAEASIATLVQVLQAVPGVVVVRQEAGYLQATARTRWLGFVDDLEFWLDPNAGVIHVRSASRLGREDFGANRKRIEALRQAYEALP